MCLCMKNLPLLRGRWKLYTDYTACWAKHRLVFFDLQTLKCVTSWFCKWWHYSLRTKSIGRRKFYVIKLVELSSKILNLVHLYGHWGKRNRKRMLLESQRRWQFQKWKRGLWAPTCFGYSEISSNNLIKVMSSDKREILFEEWKGVFS